MAQEALFCRDDGTSNVPGEDSTWKDWVSPSRCRNFCHQDPCLDWLNAWGADQGFTPDTELSTYDPRTDFPKFIMRKGSAFEAVVLDYLQDRHQLVRILDDKESVRDKAAVTRTWEAMVEGTKLIASAPLWNPQNQTYGIADLLVRSDLLTFLFPDSVPEDMAQIPAPDIPGSEWHYRVIDIKFTTLQLLKDGHANAHHLPAMTQVWIYNEALGRIQGLTPESGYLLGRAWKTSKDRGNSALERLARIDHDHAHRRLGPLREIVAEACSWLRRVASDGSSWAALPEPTIDELRPNFRNASDYPWHAAKARIAHELEDLTIVPRVTPTARAEAISTGLSRWTSPDCTAERCGITSAIYAAQVNAIIEANHSPADGAIVFPPQITANEDVWRDPAPAEFFVDFETVSDVDDDFARFPVKGGQPLIFMIGCGHVVDGVWEFRVFTVGRLSEDEERRIITEWLDHVEGVCRECKIDLNEARLYHWSQAEVSTLERAYNAAVKRHGVPEWGGLPWVDLLTKVAREAPLTVRGASGFGLKAIAKAMHANDLISTSWEDGPADGLGAMVGAWWCEHEAELAEADVRSLDLMQEIEHYNEVDCRVMNQILRLLRESR